MKSKACSQFGDFMKFKNMNIFSKMQESKPSFAGQKLYHDVRNLNRGGEVLLARNEESKPKLFHNLMIS